MPRSAEMEVVDPFWVDYEETELPEYRLRFDNDYWGEDIDPEELSRLDIAFLHAIQHDGLRPHLRQDGHIDSVHVFNRLKLNGGASYTAYNEIVKSEKRLQPGERNLLVADGVIVTLPEDTIARVVDWYEMKLDKDRSESTGI